MVKRIGYRGARAEAGRKVGSSLIIQARNDRTWTKIDALEVG